VSASLNCWGGRTRIPNGGIKIHPLVNPRSERTTALTRLQQPSNPAANRYEKCAPRTRRNLEPGAPSVRLTVRAQEDGHERAKDCTVIRVGPGRIAHVRPDFERVRLLAPAHRARAGEQRGRDGNGDEDSVGRRPHRTPRAVTHLIFGISQNDSVNEGEAWPMRAAPHLFPARPLSP
jgi:hypothetical protein